LQARFVSSYLPCSLEFSADVGSMHLFEIYHMFNLAKNTTHCLLFKINLAGNKLQYTSAKHDKNEKKNISHRQNSLKLQIA
jgi:hypothetical protein